MSSILFEILCGMPCAILLTAVGLYFTVKSNVFQIKRIKYIIRAFVPQTQNTTISSFSAFATAIGGTVGVGSITGIGYSVAVGGAGSIFWMWICSFLGMMTKYAETFIAVKHREKTEKGFFGGAMFVLRKCGFRKLGFVFALSALTASLFGGNIAQANAFSHAVSDQGGNALITAVITAAIIAWVIFGGQKRIAKLNAVLVPTASILYIVLTGTILISLRVDIHAAFIEIFRDAFGIRQTFGGISAYAFINAMRTGSIRGVFSHEAGMGSSALAHSAAEDATPHKQGMCAVAEIYVDTFIVGTLTALCVIAAKNTDIKSVFFGFFGTFGEYIFIIMLAVFAFAAMISWCFYCEGSLYFIFGDNKFASFAYRTVFVLCAFSGCLASSETAWKLADIFNCMMIGPNIFIILLKRKEITYEKLIS